MKRTSGVVLIVTALVGYAAIAGLGIALIEQQSELRSISTRLDHLTGSSPAAVISPTPTVNPSPTAAPSPAFAQLTKVTDNFGHTWIFGPVNGTANVLVNSKFTFTAVASDPLNRPIEYAYTVGRPPDEKVVCDWGGAMCSWTAPATPQTIVVTVYVRAKNSPNKISPCEILDSCDASLSLEVLTGT